MDACPGWWQSSQCRLSAPMARQPYTAGPKQTSRSEIWVRDLPDHLWAKQFVFSRWRDARLQLVHGLRFSQRCHSGVWTSLTLSLDGKPTANSIMLRMLDQIYAVSPLQ